jgi:hypothetical protein
MWQGQLTKHIIMTNPHAFYEKLQKDPTIPMFLPVPQMIAPTHSFTSIESGNNYRYIEFEWQLMDNSVIIPSYIKCPIHTDGMVQVMIRETAVVVASFPLEICLKNAAPGDHEDVVCIPLLNVCDIVSIASLNRLVIIIPIYGNLDHNDDLSSFALYASYTKNPSVTNCRIWHRHISDKINLPSKTKVLLPICENTSGIIINTSGIGDICFIINDEFETSYDIVMQLMVSTLICQTKDVIIYHFPFTQGMWDQTLAPLPSSKFNDKLKLEIITQTSGGFHMVKTISS